MVRRHPIWREWLTCTDDTSVQSRSGAIIRRRLLLSDSGKYCVQTCISWPNKLFNNIFFGCVVFTIRVWIGIIHICGLVGNECKREKCQWNRARANGKLSSSQYVRNFIDSEYRNIVIGKQAQLRSYERNGRHCAPPPLSTQLCT